MATPHASTPLRRPGPLALIQGGAEAFRTVPGLRGFVVRGFLLNYGVFLLSALVGMGLLYVYVVAPLGAGLETLTLGEGLLWDIVGGLLTLLLWLTQALLMAATLLLSFLVALTLMGLWYEALAARIIRHWRGREAGEGGAFSLRLWAGTLWREVRTELRLLGLALLALLLGFVPLAGPFLVIGINAFLLGREVREPYLVMRSELGESLDALRRGTRVWTAGIGLVPVVLAMIPVAGWVVLPAAMIYMVAGLAWHNERSGV